MRSPIHYYYDMKNIPEDLLRLSLDLRNFQHLSLRSNGLNGCDPSSSTVTSSGLLSLKPTTVQSLPTFSSTK